MKIQIFQGGSVPNAPENLRADSFAYPQELTQVLTRTKAELYRPRRWRDYIPVESVETWAQRVEDRRYNFKIENPVLASNKGPTQGVPMPSFTTSNQFLPIYEFLLSYGYTDRDVELAAHLGQSLPSDNQIACNEAFEYYLETVASVGDTSNGVVLKGLGNLADVTSATAENKASGSDTPWNDATAAEIVTDLVKGCHAVELASKENRKCNLVLLPLAQKQKAATTFTAALESTALDLFRRIMPGVRVESWNVLSNQGAGSTPCAMFLDTTNPYGARMLMQREASYGQPLRGANGWVTFGKIATGGVRAIDPTSIVKMSGL
jgi:hypothetical protein